MITPDQLTAAIIGVLLGILATAAAAYRYISKSITPDEALEIYETGKAAMDEYNRAMADGALTTDEKLKIAEKTLSTLDTVIKALQS